MAFEEEWAEFRIVDEELSVRVKELQGAEFTGEPAPCESAGYKKQGLDYSSPG